MQELEERLERLDQRHQEALLWFHRHRDRTLPWADIQAHADIGSRLVNQAKGIYKPAYTDYALSLRTLQEGPYPDKEVERRPDGSWVCQYYQENPDPAKRDREATNRGLIKCMEDRIPIGFLIKRKPKPGVEYEILGLGYVIEWSAGYFTIEGLREDGTAHYKVDATRSRARHGVSSYLADYNATDETDRRERTIATIAMRRGQAAFRASLLHAYGGRCCITGCDLADALEAAHITPYRGQESNHLQNGLLLRSDVHTLFDLGLIAIGEDRRVLVAPQLRSSESYRHLEGHPVVPPSESKALPSAEALLRHRIWAGL